MTIFVIFKETQMKYFFVIKNTILFLFAFVLFSCASRKDVVYFQNIDNLSAAANKNSYEIKIQPDDLLMIIVSAEDPESAIPFNLSTVNLSTNNNLNSVRGQETIQYYLVNANGTIDFPTLGKLNVGGLSKSEVLEMMKSKISKYINNPIVNLRIMNFKVSVQGEVTAPGTYTITSERVTLIEALGLARDLTIYGKRNNILIIREVNGVKSYNRVDISKADFINSSFYYLSQNDVVYVEPNNVKINGAAVGPNTGVFISIAGILISLITLIATRIK
jgi:polysaccharide export outer membrane protein